MQAALTYLLSCVPLFALPVLIGSKWRFRWFRFMLALYLLTYLSLSVQGRFLTANHGGMDWQDHWAPLGLVEPTTRNHRRGGRADVELSWAGTQFWPLIILDNAFWHRTHESDLSKDST